MIRPSNYIMTNHNEETGENAADRGHISWCTETMLGVPEEIVSVTLTQKTVLGECVLSLQEAFVADSGLYSCKAVNSSGLAETKASVLVRGERFRIRIY